MGDPGRRFTRAEIAEWEKNNRDPLPVLDLNRIARLRRLSAGARAYAAAVEKALAEGRKPPRARTFND